MNCGEQKSAFGIILLVAAVICGCNDQQAQKIGDATAESAKSASRALSVAAEQLGNAATKLKQQVGEAELTGKVYARLHWDKQLQSAQISIDSQQGGIVVIAGTVATEDLRERIVDIAANTVGVREVRDQIKVTGQAPERRNNPTGSTEEFVLPR